MQIRPHQEKVLSRPFHDLFFLFVLFLIAGCASQDPSTRRHQAEQLATQAGWVRTTLETPAFTLATFAPQAPIKVDTLTVYIEGDGFAWVNASTPSMDPTPRDPLALKLALLDRAGTAVYLARPCQFVQEREQRNCSTRYWISHRFATEVIESTNNAIDQLKNKAGAKHLKLIGYSGGGAVAALVAARRTDVTALITVAGNLDHAAWTDMHRITPLSGSLNAADASPHLQQIPQRHYVGQKDAIIGAGIARSYAARFGSPGPAITVMPDFDHRCCWTAVWPSLVAKNFDLADR